MVRVPSPDRSYMMAEVERDGKQELARSRMAEFNAARDRRLSKDKENIATIVVVVVGALTFSVAPQLLSSQSGRGSIAVSAGLAGGAAASFFAHASATKVLTGLKLKQGSAQARKALVEKMEREEV